MARPKPTDYSLYSAHYIMKVKEDDINSAFKNQQLLLEDFLQSIPDTKADYSYAEGKWTVKQLLQHIIDTERIFTFRSLWIARGSTQPLTSFDENVFAKEANVQNRTIDSLRQEMLAVRKTTEYFFNNLTNTDLSKKGKLNDHLVTVNALGYIMVGHVIHHIQVYKERYV